MSVCMWGAVWLDVLPRWPQCVYTSFPALSKGLRKYADSRVLHFWAFWLFSCYSCVSACLFFSQAMSVFLSLSFGPFSFSSASPCDLSPAVVRTSWRIRPSRLWCPPVSSPRRPSASRCPSTSEILFRSSRSFARNCLSSSLRPATVALRCPARRSLRWVRKGKSEVTSSLQLKLACSETGTWFKPGEYSLESQSMCETFEMRLWK